MSQSLQSMSESPRADGVSTGGWGGGDGSGEKGRGRGGEVEETCCTVSGAGVLQLTNIRFMHLSSWLVLTVRFQCSKILRSTFQDKFWTVTGQIGRDIPEM